MITEFIDRENELQALQKTYEQPSFQFYPIYGRRRVGKTELILQFIKNKPHIYYIATEGTEKENIKNFKRAAQPIFNLNLIKDDFEDIFEYISKQKITKKIIIVIDEYPFLLKANKALSSTFQRIIDLYLHKKNIFLILCGSSVSMMYKEVLGYKAPLYGRRTGQIELKPLRFTDVQQFLHKSIEECIQIYGACGGIPYYLKEFREKKDFFQLVEEKILAPEAILNKEAIVLLRQELDEISRYASILGAISLGNTKLGEIMNYCGFNERLNISPYLNILDRLGIAEKEIPVTQGLKTRGVYKIKDHFFKFYFRYVRPYESTLEENRKEIITFIKKDYDVYLGTIFEDIAREFIAKKIRTKTGRWWYQDKEIDIVSINENTNNIFFFECKWKKLKDREAHQILGSLREKTENVTWKNNKRTEHLGLIAKKIDNKEELRNEGYHVYDQTDWE